MNLATRIRAAFDIAGPLLFGTALALTLAIGAADSASQQPARLETAGPAGGRAVLELATSPPVTMTPVPFSLRLTDRSGAPLQGADVRCDLTMPAMPMPENRPAVKEKAPGIYSGVAIFTMAGAWQAAFDITLRDGNLQELTFTIEQVQLK